MLDDIAVGFVVLSLVVLVFTRANRYLVIGTLVSIALAAYGAAGAWMSGALSVALDDQSSAQQVRSARIFELITVMAVSATVGCLVLAWRRRPNRGNGEPRQNPAQSATL